MGLMINSIHNPIKEISRYTVQNLICITIHQWTKTLTNRLFEKSIQWYWCFIRSLIPSTHHKSLINLLCSNRWYLMASECQNAFKIWQIWLRFQSRQTHHHWPVCLCLVLNRKVQHFRNKRLILAEKLAAKKSALSELSLRFNNELWSTASKHISLWMLPD